VLADLINQYAATEANAGQWPGNHYIRITPVFDTVS